jgi:hypothetical protein
LAMRLASDLIGMVGWMRGTKRRRPGAYIARTSDGRYGPRPCFGKR